MTGIYKITNKINGKCYIGESVDIEARWKMHQTRYNRENKEYYKILYAAFRKYGIENFSFEIIEECEPSMLFLRETYWISYYDSQKKGYNKTPGGNTVGETNIGESHANHKLSEADVVDIRTRYGKRERKKSVYEIYKNKISKSGFHKVWNGATWSFVHMDVYTEENINFHKHNTANKGSSNGRALLTEDDVKNIRTRRKNGEKILDVYHDYKDKLTFGSFKNVWIYQNWKSIII